MQYDGWIESVTLGLDRYYMQKCVHYGSQTDSKSGGAQTTIII
jgi:hypothetical protein